MFGAELEQVSLGGRQRAWERGVVSWQNTVELRIIRLEKRYNSFIYFCRKKNWKRGSRKEGSASGDVDHSLESLFMVREENRKDTFGVGKLIIRHIFPFFSNIHIEHIVGKRHEQTFARNSRTFYFKEKGKSGGCKILARHLYLLSQKNSH